MALESPLPTRTGVLTRSKSDAYNYHCILIHGIATRRSSWHENGPRFCIAVAAVQTVVEAADTARAGMHEPADPYTLS